MTCPQSTSRRQPSSRRSSAWPRDRLLVAAELTASPKILVKLQRLACELTRSCSRATFRQGSQRSVLYVRIGTRSYAQPRAATAAAQQSAGTWAATSDGLGADWLRRPRHRRRRRLLSEPARIR